MPIPKWHALMPALRLLRRTVEAFLERKRSAWRNLLHILMMCDPTLLVIVFVCSSGNAAHHLNELVEVDLAVAVVVDFSDRLVELILSVHIFEFVAG